MIITLAVVALVVSLVSLFISAVAISMAVMTSEATEHVVSVLERGDRERP